MISVCGCNKYIVSTTPENIYYGAFNRRDMIHADVKVYKLNSNQECDGLVVLNAPSRSITLKNDRVDAVMKLACNDGTLLDLDWELRKGSFSSGSGVGIDQFNNKYEFKTVSKDVYKKIAEKNKITFPNDKNKSYLKY